MTSRRSFIAAGAGAVAAALASCGGGGGGNAAPVLPPSPPPSPPPTPEPPPATPPPTPPAPDTPPAWSEGFMGANLALGESIDLRVYTSDADGDSLTFSLNAASTPIGGILTLTSNGMLTRVGTGDVAGVLIDADDGK